MGLSQLGNISPMINLREANLSQGRPRIIQ
jgi:hypothetical protein